MSPIIVSMGNPLLDITVTGEDGFKYLAKYELKADDAILAEEKHMPIYDDIVANAEVTYVAGGAAQNAARAAAYILPAGSVAYLGSVGDDDLKATLQKANEAEGVQSAYQVHPAPTRTGACAVVITGHHRSLCTTLRAAEKFEVSHLKTPEVEKLLADAKYFYIEGYFLTHGIESALLVAQQASASGKTVVLNLSAPFIAQFFKVQLEQLLPHVDILIGNESEAAAYAEGAGMGVSPLLFWDCLLETLSDVAGMRESAADSQKVSVAQAATALAAFTKSNTSRPRLVVITQGADSTLVASSSPTTHAANLQPGEENPKTYPVPKLSADKVIDTNGAGDMFAGGFLGALALGKPLDTAIEVGHKCGQMCVGLSGPKLVYPKVNML